MLDVSRMIAAFQRRILYPVQHDDSVRHPEAISVGACQQLALTDATTGFGSAARLRTGWRAGRKSEKTEKRTTFFARPTENRNACSDKRLRDLPKLSLLRAHFARRITCFSQ
jgi:hypothetical protein